MSEIKRYVGNIEPAPKTIFVFGSNPAGIHGAGAARVAVLKFGAVMGNGEGLQGQAYALPTKDLRVKENNGLRSIKPEAIIFSIQQLYECARAHPDLDFKIAYRNTDEVTLNGYSGYEMMDMFLAFIWDVEQYLRVEDSFLKPPFFINTDQYFSEIKARKKKVLNHLKTFYKLFCDADGTRQGTH